MSVADCIELRQVELLIKAAH